MPNVMIRENSEGVLTLYIPKKDLEDIIVSVEHTDNDNWGGEITIGDGSSYFIPPAPKPDFPVTIRARRASGD